MRYYRIERGDSVSLVVRDETAAYDLSAGDPDPTSFEELAKAASLTNKRIDDIATELSESAPTVDFASLQSDSVRPIDPGEVWGAGVTYAISQEARQDKGGLAESYLDAYEGDRPEVFFKATPSRTVGPSDAVGIRGDSDWNVPEPELALILYEGDVVGFTVGNDVCSRSIEQQNLLYLPQSKTYSKSCAIGPCIATEETVTDPLDLEMEMTISRDHETVFNDATSTSEMVRTCEELTSYLTRYNEIPELTVLLTGTSIIPPDDVTLRSGDQVAIEIENIGTLRNTVEKLDYPG